jgi:crotonobetainyl-CoA:carnitine CoA-transferase CaiB-like acyl-CoA transferase
VFIQNFRPGVAERLGVGPSGCRGINPRLVYCGISGFGNDGPWKDRPAFDTVSQAVTGFLRLLVNPANPRVVGPAIGDAVTGFYAAFGVVAALYERETTGKGRLVETSMFEAMSHFNMDDFTHYLSEGEVMGRGRGRTCRRATCSSAPTAGGSRCTCRARRSSGRTSPRRSGSRTCCSGPSSRAGRRGSPTTRRWSNSLRRSSRSSRGAYWEQRLAALEVPHSPVYTSKEVVEGELRRTTSW